MKFNIFQHNITKAYTDQLTEVGFHGDLGEYELDAKITRDVTFWGSESWEPAMASKFKLVATCEANDLEDVFHMGNGYGDQTMFNRVSDMHSLSVGDLVECVDTGDMLMVDPTGWTSVSYFGLGEVA